jgi:hypothetical protein
MALKSYSESLVDLTEFETMKTNFINSVFATITILFLAACASMTQAPSTPPSATVRIQEWSTAYYGSAAAGKGTLYYNGQRHISLFLVLVSGAWEVRRSPPLARFMI